LDGESAGPDEREEGEDRGKREGRGCRGWAGRGVASRHSHLSRGPPVKPSSSSSTAAKLPTALVFPPLLLLLVLVLLLVVSVLLVVLV
jgi:hypothetical protein